MNKQLYQLDEFQPQQSSNMESTVVNDLKLSETTLNDLFSEFDVNTNDFQFFDGSTNNINYSQSTPDLSPSYNNPFHSRTTNNNTQNLETVSYEVFSPNSFKSLIEQYQTQQPNIILSSSPPDYISTDHYESSSANMSNYQSDQITATRQQTITNGSSSSIQFPALVKKTEPIQVTFDQFQALINATTDASKANSNTISTFLENSTIIGHNIPLKIVPQTTHCDNSNRSDELNYQDSLTNNNNKSITKNRNGRRTRRNSSHNAIEKRYRSSINEKIHELKEIVAASDRKVGEEGLRRRFIRVARDKGYRQVITWTEQLIQKSGILLRTIEYIRQLQSTNQRLEEENSTLKNILKQLNLTNDDFPNNNHVRSTKRNSSVKNPSTYIPVTKRQKQTNSKRGMVDRSRLVLCFFMLCILITNPFNYLLNHIDSSNNINTNEIQSIISSRTLKSTIDNENFNSSIFLNISWKQLIAWMINIAICLSCFIKLFVYGEPFVHQSEMNEYYSYKKKADQFINENQLNEAMIYYEKCCEQLYVSMDKTYIYYFSSIICQISRLCFNLIYVSRWLTESIDRRYYNLELNHCFFQLWKIEYYYSKSFLNLFNLFLLTINTSINSGEKFDKNKRNEIYLLTILTLKKLNRLFISYLLKYFIPNDFDINYFNKFLSEKNINLFKHKSFIQSIHIQYFQYILYDHIKNQLLYQQQENFLIKNPNEFDQFSWWKHSLQVIHCISSNKQNITSNQTIYYLTRSKQFVDERYIMIIETIHNILLVLTDNNDQTNSTRILLLEQLGQLSRMLTLMIKINNEDNLDLAIKTLLLDGILSLRLRLLTNSLTNNNQQIPFLDDFQRELDHYRQLNQFMKLPKQRYYLFESIFRALSGLNPLIIETLFECAIQQSNSIIQLKEKSLPNLDIIAALLLFCHFSPSTVYRYRNILQQAVATSLETNKNNDLNRLQQQCLTLIRQPYFTL